MPALDNITITLTDMNNITKSVSATGYKGPIKIIDAIYTYTVRDINDNCIADIKKNDTEYAYNDESPDPMFH